MIKNSLFFLLLIVIFSCKDKVTKFSGFTQTEMEFLLASSDAKIWERISREEDGEEIFLEGCEAESYLIFLQDEVGDPKPLLYAYNPAVCDSLDFCALHPDFCISDTTLCAENPDFCDDLQDGILFIGSWYVKEPFIENSRADTLIFEINEKSESIHVTSITANYATFSYKNRTGSSGGSVIESYQFVPSDTEQ
jgi:hypothetical protein